jgi:hypothetical protein
MTFDPRHARDNQRGMPTQHGNTQQGNVEHGTVEQGTVHQGATSVRREAPAHAAQATTRVTTTQPAPVHTTTMVQEPMHGTTATATREPVQPRPPEPPPHRSHMLWKILGILGMLALGGLIAGLVASRQAPTPPAVHHPRVPQAARQLNSWGTHGSGRSPNFTVPTNSVQSSYGYACPAGTSGRFEANLVGNSGGPTQSIVNTTSTNASGEKTVHIAHPGTEYHVAATAPAGCAYRINTGTPTPGGAGG